MTNQALRLNPPPADCSGAEREGAALSPPLDLTREQARRLAELNMEQARACRRTAKESLDAADFYLEQAEMYFDLAGKADSK